MAKALKWLLHELVHVLPAVVFFFVAFLLINYTTELMVKKHGIKIAGIPAIVLGAFVVGKVLLVIDNLPVSNMFSGRPLIYGTMWKTVIYSVAGLVYRLIEQFVPFLSAHVNVAEAYVRYRMEIDWPRFWAVQIWVVMLFFFFATLREVIRVLGPDRVRRMFFG